MATTDALEVMRTWLAETLYLRQQASNILPAPGAVPQRTYEALIYLRAILDRMETLQSSAIGMTGSARRYARAMGEQADDAYDEAAARLRRTGRYEDYVSAKERHADASLAVLPQLRASRQAIALRDEAEEILDRIKSAYRWTDEARRDMRAALGYLTWESHLER